MRSENADALKVAEKVDEYLVEIAPTLPANLRLEQYDIQADLIRGRIKLLLVNGGGGLVLVLLILFVFLNTPTAFWVAMGIPTSAFRHHGRHEPDRAIDQYGQPVWAYHGAGYHCR